MDILEEKEAFLNVYVNYQGDSRKIPFNEETEQFMWRKNNVSDTEVEYVHLMNQRWYAWLACAKSKAQAVPEWISVKEQLPKKNVNVLLNLVVRSRVKPISCIGFYSIEPDDEPCFILDDNFTILKGVTHWMQLPQAPKAQEPAID